MNERIEYRLSAKPGVVFDPLRQSAAARRCTRWSVERMEVEVRTVNDRGTQEVVHVHYLRDVRG